MNCHFWAPIWSTDYGRLRGSSEWDKPWEAQNRHGEGYSLFICGVEIRLQEILGDAGMPLVRCVLVRWELLVQENVRVVQTHCTQSPWLERSVNCCVWDANVSFLQNLSLGSLKTRWQCTESSGVCQGWLLVKKNLFYQDYSRSFCSLKLVKIGQKHKGSAPATMVGRDLRKCLSSRTCKR